MVVVERPSYGRGRRRESTLVRSTDGSPRRDRSDPAHGLLWMGCSRMAHTQRMRDAVPHRREPSEAQALLHAIDIAVADAESDLDVVLLQPRLLDPRQTTAARFAVERAQVRQLVSSAPESWLATSSVNDLRESWRSLKDEARRAGLHGRPWREKRRIRRARRLLEYARSDRGSPAMRVSAYRRGLLLLDGLISVPELLRCSIYEAAALVPPPRTPGPDFPTWG